MSLKKVEQIEEFDIQRKVVAKTTTQSWKEIPHVAYMYEPDVTDLCSELKLLNERRDSQANRITLNTLMIKIISEGLKSAPLLNAHLDYRVKTVRGQLKIKKEIHAAIPWLLENGKMITPAIHYVNDMNLADISKSIADISRKINNTNVQELLYEAAKADTISEIRKLHLGVIRRAISSAIHTPKGKRLSKQEKEQYYKIPATDRLTEQDLRRATVTISNIGSLYREQRGAFAMLEVVPPQVFVVGLGAIQEKPAVYLDHGVKTIGIRKILPICLAFDHRAGDFNDMVPFLKRLDKIFAHPQIIHKWI